VSVVKPFEGLGRWRAGQKDLSSRPLHQALILQSGYDPGDRALQDAQHFLDGARICRLQGAGDENQCANLILAEAERHYLNNE